MKVSSLIKSFFIFLCAPILALGLFFFTRDLTGLTASVLDLSELQRIEENKWGVAYKTEHQFFELFGSEMTRKGENLTFELVYNPQKVNLFVDQSSGFDFMVLENSAGFLKLQLNQIGTLPLDEGFFQLPFSGDGGLLVLAEAFLSTSGGDLIPLSIGNLNSEGEHSFLP